MNKEACGRGPKYTVPSCIYHLTGFFGNGVFNGVYTPMHT